VERGEWQDDEIHDRLDGHPIKQAADQRMLNQEAELAAGGVVNGGDGRSDKEVQQDAQGVGGRASMKRGSAE